jgi:hypothetical protein
MSTSQPLKGSPYLASVADSTGMPTVNWPGGIGTIDAGRITLSGGRRTRRARRRSSTLRRTRRRDRTRRRR